MIGSNLQLKNMTWPEIGQRIQSGQDSVIINLASTEQHGLHLAECTDEVIGLGLACGLAERLGDALVAPPIIPGLSEHHLALPGSLSIRPEIFKGIIEDYVTCYKNHGFKKFILLASHGGNMDTANKMADEFNVRFPDDRFISALTLESLMKILMTYEMENNMPAGSCGGHACAFETSIMLYFAPELVKMDKAKAGYVGLPSKELINSMFENGILGISEIGVIGDPTLATRELGEKFYNSVLDDMEKHVREQLK